MYKVNFKYKGQLIVNLGARLFMGLLFMHSVAYGQALSVQGNGHVGDLSLRSDEAFSLSLSIDAQGLSNQADWFVIKQSAAGFQYFDLNAGTFVEGTSASLQGPLTSASADGIYTVSSGMAVGNYTFYFGVDTTVNGQVDTDTLTFSALNLTVTAAPISETAQLVAAVEQDCAGTFDTSATEEPLSFQVDGRRAIFRGLIDGTTPAKVSNLLSANPDLRTIVLAYGPGSDDDDSNLEASLAVHNAGIATCVPAGGEIYSGAVDFFLAGNIRRLADDAIVGVHSWADGSGVNGNDLPQDHPDHRLFLDYYETIGVSREFYFFTLEAAPPSGIHNMTAEERVTHNMEKP